MNKFKGIFPALLTPFNKDGSVNTSSLIKLVEYNLEKGVDGFYVAGSTGEAFLLTDEERKLVYKTVADVAKGRCTLIAHIGCISTMQAIEFAKYAKSLGYDAMSSVAPFYYGFGVMQIKKYYHDIMDAVDLPMIIYNIPAFSGVTMSTDDLAELIGDKRVLGLKHTSNDFFMLEQLRTKFADKIFYNGYDEMFLSGLAMGADGGIGSTYNFMAEKFIKIRNLFCEGKIEEAREVQKVANKIITILIKVGVMAGEKEVLTQLGIEMGDCRPPFAALTDEQKKLIKDEILPLL